MPSSAEKADQAVERYKSYMSSFPVETQEYETKLLEKPIDIYDAIEDNKEAKQYIDDRTDELRKHIGQGRGSQVGGMSIIKSLATLVQSVGKRWGLLLYGDKTTLVETVGQNEAQFNSLIKEIACKYAMDKFVEPEARLGLLSLQCIYTTHTINTHHRKSVAENIENNVIIVSQDNHIQPTERLGQISEPEQLSDNITNTDP